MVNGRIYLNFILKMTQIDVYLAGGCCRLTTFKKYCTQWPLRYQRCLHSDFTNEACSDLTFLLPWKWYYVVTRWIFKFTYWFDRTGKAYERERCSGTGGGNMERWTHKQDGKVERSTLAQINDDGNEEWKWWELKHIDGDGMVDTAA